MSTAEFTLLLTENADFLKPFAIYFFEQGEVLKVSNLAVYSVNLIFN